jgi:hypothetical protein
MSLHRCDPLASSSCVRRSNVVQLTVLLLAVDSSACGGGASPSGGFDSTDSEAGARPTLSVTQGTNGTWSAAEPNQPPQVGGSGTWNAKYVGP